VLLLHIPTSGYDVCGDKMLGIRWRSAFEFVLASWYICDVTMSPNTFFSRPRALCSEILVSNILKHSLVGVKGGQHNFTICGSSILYRCKQSESGFVSMS